jgi:hypothetical protein
MGNMIENVAANADGRTRPLRRAETLRSTYLQDLHKPANGGGCGSTCIYFRRSLRSCSPFLRCFTKIHSYNYGYNRQAAISFMTVPFVLRRAIFRSFAVSLTIPARVRIH